MFNFAQKFIDRLSVVSNLKEAIVLVTKSMEQSGHPERIQYAYDDIEHNEYRLALESLCENLYEFSCPIPQRAYELFKKTGTNLEIDSKYWELLQPLIIKQVNEKSS